MSNSVIKATDVIVHENHSGLDDRMVAHKVRDQGFAKGCHVLLFQNRYGDVIFLMDWRTTGGPADWDDHARRNWNALIDVK